MAQTWALSTDNRSADYGSFYTSLYLMEGSSSDSVQAMDEDITEEARDVLAGIPVLRWNPIGSGDNNIVEAVTMLAARSIDAVEAIDGTLPLKRDLLEGVKYSVTGTSLRLASDQRSLGLFTSTDFHIDPRLAWFLREGNTLGLCINTPTKMWVSTVTADGKPPRIAVHNGAFGNKNFTNIVEYSGRWRWVHLFNHSLFSDAHNAPDHHYRTYGAFPDRVDLPSKLSYKGKCLGCGSDGRSNEHCVPNWIATKHKVIPVTAPVFCNSCNNHFGEELELPVAKSSPEYIKAQRDGDPQIFVRWALKTAFTLSAASDVFVDPQWAMKLRNGDVPDGFEVFAESNCHMSAGYMFTVTHFSQADVKDGAFLFSFCVDKLVFLVVKYKEDIGQMSVLSRLFPTHAPPRYSGDSVDVPRLHAKILENLTGEAADFTPSEPKLIKSPRG